MDIAKLRNRLEEHLKSNPHNEAPEGFRDRFEHWVAEYEAEESGEMKARLAELLQSVPDEAEAASKAGEADAADAGIEGDRGPTPIRPPAVEHGTSEAEAAIQAPRDEGDSPASPAADSERAPETIAAPPSAPPPAPASAPRPSPSPLDVQPAEEGKTARNLVIAAVILALLIGAYLLLRD